MAELADLRARLKDRLQKEGALGTTERSICLDQTLLDDLTQLQAERAGIITAKGDLRMGGTSSADTADVDRRIAAKEAEIRAESITAVFQAVSSMRYQEVVNSFEDPDRADMDKFAEALVAACYKHCWLDGEKVDLTWEEIRPQLSFGEWDDTLTKVWALNRRSADVPFSSKPSPKTRGHAAPRKPA
jgi:hypothetical protein